MYFSNFLLHLSIHLFSLVVLFYVLDSVIKRSRDGKEIAYLLKQKVSDNFFEFRMQEVEPYGMLCSVYHAFSNLEIIVVTVCLWFCVWIGVITWNFDFIYTWDQ